MMNKTYNICLTCGNVQLRTDIDAIINGNYKMINEKIYCPRCRKNTKSAVTKNIKILKKELTDNTKTQMDNHLLELIG